MSHPLSEPELAALRAVAEDVLKNHRTLVYLPAVKLLALLDEVQASRQAEPCQWHYIDDGVWHTGCGHAWEFDLFDQPTEHPQGFCGSCGRKLMIVPMPAPPSEDRP